MADAVHRPGLDILLQAAFCLAAALVLAFFAAGWIGPSWRQLLADPVTLRPSAATPERLVHAYGLLAAANAARPLAEPAVEQADLALALWRNRATPVESLQRLKAAADGLEAALQRAPAAGHAWAKLALLRWLLGRPQEARRALVIALTLDPHSRADLEQRVWLALRIWPLLSLEELPLAQKELRWFYADLNRWKRIGPLLPGPAAETFLRETLAGHPMWDWPQGDAQLHYDTVGSRSR